jgi:hypothetical protein
MYKLCPLMFGQTEPSCVKRDDGWLIPLNDPDNADYQQYLKWLEEGNTPEAAD